MTQSQWVSANIQYQMNLLNFQVTSLLTELKPFTVFLVYFNYKSWTNKVSLKVRGGEIKKKMKPINFYQTHEEK